MYTRPPSLYKPVPYLRSAGVKRKLPCAVVIARRVSGDVKQRPADSVRTFKAPGLDVEFFSLENAEGGGRLRRKRCWQ